MINDYEEHLLQKCFDTQYEQQMELVNTQYDNNEYTPPPFSI